MKAWSEGWSLVWKMEVWSGGWRFGLEDGGLVWRLEAADSRLEAQV